MRITIDSNGDILCVSIVHDMGEHECLLPVPSDLETDGCSGKYRGRLVGDKVEVYAVPGWVPPPPPSPLTPDV